MEVRRDLPPLLGAQGALEDEPRHAGLLGGLDEVACPLDHHRLELLGASEQDGDEVHDRRASLDGAPQALGVGHVALHDLAAPRAELVLLLGAACEHADGQLCRAQRVDDLRAHEPGASGDQDHDRKFFQ